MGINEEGQLGLGHTDNQSDFQLISTLENKRVVKVFCGPYHNLAYTGNRYIYSISIYIYAQYQNGPSDQPSIYILMSFFFSSPLFTNQDTNELYCWGLGTDYQLGTNRRETETIPTKLEFFTGKKVVSMAAGLAHSLIATSTE